MLADSAAAAMAVVVLEAASLPCRPVQKTSCAGAGSSGSSQGSRNNSRHSTADEAGGVGMRPSRQPPLEAAERLAAAGCLADLTWVLEHAGSSPAAPSGSQPHSLAAPDPSKGLWLAYHALAAVAGCMEGAVQYARFPRNAAAMPSATLQSAVARASGMMVDTAQRLLASGACGGSGRSSGSSGDSYSSPVKGSRQHWRADSAPFRMACTGVTSAVNALDHAFNVHSCIPGLLLHDGRAKPAVQLQPSWQFVKVRCQHNDQE